MYRMNYIKLDFWNIPSDFLFSFKSLGARVKQITLTIFAENNLRRWSRIESRIACALDH